MVVFKGEKFIYIYRVFLFLEGKKKKSFSKTVGESKGKGLFCIL